MAFSVPPYTIGLSHEYGKQAPSGNWVTIYDGAVIPEGVIYATSTRMAASIGGQYVVDVADGNEANGIQNWVNSQVGYIMRADDIRVIWRYSPAAASISPLNTYYWLWLNYSFDNDGLSCDYNPTDDWPSQWWGEPRYFESNRQSWDGFVTGTLLPANSVIGPLSRGTQCTKGNPGRYTNGAPASGDWVRFGESNSSQAGARRLTLRHEIDSSWGTPVSWDFFGVANEDWDGVWGVGGQRFSFVSPILWSPGVWYTTSYTISLQ